MGYSLSWLAIKGKPLQAVLDEIGFCAIGVSEEIPESALSAAELPNDWHLIVSNQSEAVVPDDLLRRLSANCEAITCFAEEHVMCSHAAGWKDGNKRWSVIHNAQKQRHHLETQGDLPPWFGSILSQLESKQREADARKQRVDFIFDVPIELAYTITGYRHDRSVPGLSGKPFEVLLGSAPAPPASSSAPPKASFWKRWFGK
jgi:hypothetical protein